MDSYYGFLVFFIAAAMAFLVALCSLIKKTEQRIEFVAIGCLLSMSLFYFSMREGIFGKIDFLAQKLGTVYEVVGLPNEPGLRATKIYGWDSSFMVNFDCAKIRGGCASIPIRGIPFKLVEGAGEDDLVVVTVDTVALSDAARSKQK